MADMMVAALAVLEQGLLALGLRVIVEGTCPSAAAVEAQLRPLLPAGALSDEKHEGNPPDGLAGPRDGLRAHIERLDELLRVEVRSETGALLTVRDLQGTAPCPALAAAAAVVIASALTSLPREVPEPSVELPKPPPPPPVVPPPPRRPAVLWELEAGAVLALTRQAVTGGGSLGGELSPSAGRLARRFGVRLLATAVGWRSEPLDVGPTFANAAANWTRIELLVAPRYRLLLERPLVELYAGVAGAAALVQGSGLARSYFSQAADIGLSGGLRVGRVQGRLSLWVDLGFVGWLRPQDLSLAQSPPIAQLPAWDILMSAGLSFGRMQP